jgi:RNA polymerase-binding transcription factor DksA
MDIIDEAHARTEHFQRLAMANRVFDMPPMAPQRSDTQGNALCIDCETNINQRRQYVASAQRCTECQHDQDRQQQVKRGK